MFYEEPVVKWESRKKYQTLVCFLNYQSSFEKIVSEAMKKEGTGQDGIVDGILQVIGKERGSER